MPTEGSPSPAVSITVLGAFSFAVDGTVTRPGGWARRSSASLVKILALTPGHRLHREHVIDLLWPDEDPGSAANRLHKAAHFARRAAGHPDAVVLHSDLVWLFPDAEITVDALRFEDLARQAVSDEDPALAREALSWYGGELLPSDRYEEWAGERRELLALRRLDVLRVDGEWREVAELDPTDEDAATRLIRRHADAGDGTAAVREFERLERALHRDLGVPPNEAARRARAEALLAELTSLERRQRALLAELEAVGELGRVGDLAKAMA